MLRILIAVLRSFVNVNLNFARRLNSVSNCSHAFVSVINLIISVFKQLSRFYFLFAECLPIVFAHFWTNIGQFVVPNRSH